MIDSFYCPKCGEQSECSFNINLSPGYISYCCPLCFANWKIKIEFLEIESKEFINE